MVLEVLVVVEAAIVVDEVVFVAGHPPTHASQQLGRVPIVAVPPLGGRQSDGLYLTLHFSRPTG